MASSSYIQRGERSPLAFADIEEKLRDSNMSRDTILSLINIIEGNVSADNKTIKDGLQGLIDETSEHKLSKLLVLFNELLINSAQLPAKEEVQESEQKKRDLITHLYIFGNEEDKKFLSVHFDGEHAYLRMLEEMVAAGGEWVIDALTLAKETPAELSSIYHTWRMARDLQAEALRKAIHKALNDLAAFHPDKFPRFKGPSIESISDRAKGKEKETDSELNVSLSESYLWVDKPASATSLVELKEKLDTLAGDPKLRHLNTFNKNNLDILAFNCRRMEDARQHNYYSQDDVQALIVATALNQESGEQTQNYRQIRTGIEVKIRHLRYAKEIARLNDTGPDNAFDAFRLKCGAEAQVNAIQALWQRRSGLVSLSSASLINLTKNVERIADYVMHAQDEIENDHSSDQGWQETVNTLYELGQLAKQSQADIMNAMLERLKLVPKDDWAMIESGENTDRTYFDDLVYETFNSLVPYGLSEQFLIEFAQQTRPTTSLTVALIKEFSLYMEANGTPDQKKELKKLIQKADSVEISVQEDENDFVIMTSVAGQEARETLVPKVKGVIAPEALYQSFVAEEQDPPARQEIDPSLMRSSGWYEMVEEKTLHFTDAKVIEVEFEETELGKFYQFLPEAPMESDEGYDYVFNVEQEQKAAIHAAQYFSIKSNQRYFLGNIKAYLLKHPASVIDEECLQFAFEKTAERLIAIDAERFDRPCLIRAKEHFVAVAKKKYGEWFREDNSINKFENFILDVTFDDILKIEQKTNKIYAELASCGWEKPELEIYKKLFLDKAYACLLENVDVNDAIKKGEDEILIATHVRTIPEKFKERFIAITRQCIAQSVDSDEAIQIAKQSINLLQVLTREKERVKTHTHGMVSSRTIKKTQAFDEKIRVVNNVQAGADLDRIKNSLISPESKLCKKRGWFSFFSCTQSTTEKNLRAFIRNESQNRM